MVQLEERITEEMSSSRKERSSELRSDSIGRESFKCSATCLYLPGFSKRRSMVRVSSEKNSIEHEKNNTEQMTEELNKEPQPENRTKVCATNDDSRGFSFEQFKRSSCNSGTISSVMADEDGYCKSPFFELRMELIRGRSSDTGAPVNAAFVFSCDPESAGTRRALQIAQSRSLQFKNKSCHVDHHDFPRPSFSCPSSPTRAHNLH